VRSVIGQSINSFFVLRSREKKEKNWFSFPQGDSGLKISFLVGKKSAHFKICTLFPTAYFSEMHTFQNLNFQNFIGNGKFVIFQNGQIF